MRQTLTRQENIATVLGLSIDITEALTKYAVLDNKPLSVIDNEKF